MIDVVGDFMACKLKTGSHELRQMFVITKDAMSLCQIWKQS